MTPPRPRFVVSLRDPCPSGSQRYRLTVGYDGTAYSGWQIQPHHPSIQETMERALHQLTGQTARIHSSGRTDAGVHAYGQSAHFDLPGRAEPARLLLGFNALLPDDIRVFTLRPAPPDFHARFSATGKEYRYHLWNGPVLPPHERWYRTHVRAPRLDLEAMRRAAAALVGTHDFAAFSANPNREIEGTVRTIRALTVRRSGCRVDLRVRGDGFLYKMVRSLAGFLIRVGRGEVEASVTETILHSGVRTARVPTAPPQGLFLWKVEYGRHDPTPVA